MPIKTFKWPGIQIPIDLNQLATAQLFNSLSLGNKSAKLGYGSHYYRVHVVNKHGQNKPEYQFAVQLSDS